MRTKALSALATLTLATAGAAVPHTAHAAIVDAHCSGTFTRTYSPAVTNVSQPVAVTSTDTYSTCTVGPAGTGATSMTLPLSCVNLTTGPATTETITWAGGGTSTVAWNPPTIAEQTVVFTGTVTGGLFTGATATKTTAGTSYLTSVLQCLQGTPVSQTTGLIADLLITS
ncbi:hypothetical protein [Actinomadura macrotermitis]|uniref:Ig-like domain-containing protein n=1 Tax=Actinomadura macrotermitis TaxID=2585200 RepID=A0A7K0BNC7_9ACTN|nr:hypothetical protein [Actinomadura macrotermitis]MQY02663.1 hypothetical protein [Actinomadura macrotermitis]